MTATDTVRRNKTTILGALSTEHSDYKFILSKVHESRLITQREYNNLKSIVETNEEIKATFPRLRDIQWKDARRLSTPIQCNDADPFGPNASICSPSNTDVLPPESKRQRKDEQYLLTSQPTGLCVIINNENFDDGTKRNGTNKDAESLAEVFSWLGFRVLMCKDQTNDQMNRALKFFAALQNFSLMQEFNIQEWSDGGFSDLQEVPQHGDAFICCILSHGEKSGVRGTDGKLLAIKEIMTTFNGSKCSNLISKPKVFFIQACQGRPGCPSQAQCGVAAPDLEADDSPQYIPVEADFLVAIATVEDYIAFRHKRDGSWFIQSVCQQLKEGCPSVPVKHPEFCRDVKTVSVMEEETVGASVEAEGGEEPKASDEALTFMSSIELTELQQCVFTDSLLTVSEGGRDLGEFKITVEFARRFEQPCVLVRARSVGAIDDAPCGTAVTAYLSADLEVLEEDHHEYVKLEDHSLDKRCHMVQHDGQLEIEKLTTVGEEVTKECVSYPMSVLRGLVTEGFSLLLMRLIALKKNVPEHMTFISFDKDLHIISTTYSELGVKQLEVGGEMLEVFGLERMVHPMEDGPTTWQCYYLSDGHLASRVQVGSPVTMRLQQLPSQPEKGSEKTSLAWEEDMQLHSKFLDRKEELKADHSSYLRQHPEIRALMSDFLQFLLLKKPDDVFQFARQHFLQFASHQPPETNLEPSSS
ncbi:hypothetical protein LDENG_00079940 [Lucifuga dentata]|nr:hypothetical protein LDENG_00079940 [Lucifuga dentata]